MRFQAQVVLVFIAVGVLVGCGSPGTAPTLPASGTLLYNGEPAKDAKVIFTPKTGRPATGKTDEDGRFVLSTFEPGDGAVPGNHLVTISDLKRNWNDEKSKSRFPSPYERTDTTPLKVVIAPENENSFTFELEQSL
jgi:hypothetical protein